MFARACRGVQRARRIGAACARPRHTSTVAKPYYVTTPIYYVNAEPHIGHLHSSVMADVMRRYANVRYGGWSPSGPILPEHTSALMTTGTDEHGLKIQRVAESQHEDPRALCDRVSLRFNALMRAADIAPTRFIRTTDADHVAAVRHFWRTLQDGGHIYVGEHAGWYAVSDEAFYPESQVRQVTKGGELVHESIESGQRVEWMTETNYKFRLSAFREPLLAWLKSNREVIRPASMYEHVVAEISSGLNDLSISRLRSRLTWGIPVPHDEDHTMYVWIDALVNYLTAIGYPSTTRGWPVDAHIVGKDIVRFHAIYWPAFLMAAGLPLPRTIVAHSHWTVHKAKMSKSKGNAINPFDAIDTYGVDTMRYYLMRIGGNIGTDADYAPALVEEHKRKFLQGQLGNLLSRVLAPKIQARLSEHGATLTQPEGLEGADAALLTACARLPDAFDTHMQAFEAAKAIGAVFDVIAQTNELVQHTAPWSQDTEPAAVHRCVYLASEALRVCGVLLTPVMPRAMHALLDALQVPREQRTWAAVHTLQPSIPLRRDTKKIAPLFPRSDA